MINNIKLGFSIFIFSLFVYFYLIPTQISEELGLRTEALGPRFFPRLATIVLAAFSLLLVGLNFYKLIKSDKSYQEIKEEEEALLEKKDFKVIGVFGILLIFINLFQYINFLVAGFVTTLLLLYFFGHRRHLYNLVISLATTFVIYYTFTYLLGIPLRV